MQSHAQNLDRKSLRNSLDDFRKEIVSDFQDFRTQCMEEFVAFMRDPWKEFKSEEPKPVPKEEPIPPVIYQNEEKDKPIKDNPVIIEEVVKPVPVTPQPQPIEPIEEQPVVVEKKVDFTFFGTRASVRFDTAKCVTLKGLKEKNIADAMASIKGEDYDNMLFDCLKLREELALSDWAYLKMLQEVSMTIAQRNYNNASLLVAYLCMQSGYKIRLATDDVKLYVLYNTKHHIYDQNYYVLDNENYYGIDNDLAKSVRICQAKFPKEKSISLYVNTAQKFTFSATKPKIIKSQSFPEMEINVTANKNLMDFYNTYPTSMIGDNFVTRWAMYANTPLDENVKKQIYPVLREKLRGLEKVRAVNKLLNMVQTGLVYEYDDKVWGGDRAFFAEESLHYPYADCEDRSILLTRLVRDLLGLKCALVYYPGHLATAIAIGEDVKGDYIRLGSEKFIICDPTYIGAPVGDTMPGMDNKSAKVIVLN